MLPTPTFDTWPVIFLVAALQGLFVALVLWRRSAGTRAANTLLATLLMLFALTLCEYVVFWTHYVYRYPHFSNTSLHFTFLYGPLVWGYLRLIFEEKKLRGADLLHLLPFAVAVLVYLPFYGLDDETKLAVITGKARFPVDRTTGRIFLWGGISHMVLYALWNYRYIRRQPRVGATARWALLLNGFFGGFIAAYASYYILVRFPFFNQTWDYHVSAAMTAFIYLIAYSGYAQPAVFNGFAWTEPEAPVKYRNSSLTPEAGRSLLKKLNALMEHENLYRDPDLSLDILAQRLEAGKHHVSQVINEHLGLSFFEYVNQLRVEEAKQLLAETTRGDLHIIEAAYAVGFNNKVSFNSAFKKATGMTPTEYRKSHGKTDSRGEQPGAVGER